MLLRKISPFLTVLRRVVPLSSDIPGLFHVQQHTYRLQHTAWQCNVVFHTQLLRKQSSLRKYCSTEASSVLEPESAHNRLIAKQDVVVRGENVAQSCDSFQEVGFEEHVLIELKRLGFKKPTTIQGCCMPIALSGRDMVGIGQTGSGKTLAYILPALLHLEKLKSSSLQRSRSPQILVLAPTRELAQQIQGVVKSFSDLYRVSSICLYGGVSKGPQMRQLENGVDICIATPGRLIDLLEMGATDMSQISYLVVDEADRMLDMGFEPQVKAIVDRITCPHQTLMWSATWPSDVRDLAKDFMSNEIQVTVGSTELTANPNISQHIHICNEDEKENMFLDLVQEILSQIKNKILVFAETKRLVDSLTKTLIWKRYPATCVHGDKSQMQRDQALYDFRSSRSRVLTATDVAARGLDITDITHIINYDFPNTIETYVHRIGRTARGQKTGTAHTYFTPSDASLAKELVDVLMKCDQTVDPRLLDLCQKSYSSKKAYYKSERFRGKDSFFNKSRSKDSFFNKSRSSYQSSNRRRSDSWSSRSEDFM